jgi:hypothetical protein
MYKTRQAFFVLFTAHEEKLTNLIVSAREFAGIILIR